MSLGPFIAENNAASTIAVAVNTTQTTIQVAAGTGSVFPNPTGSQYFVVTTFNATTNEPREIMWCTNVTGDILTVIRAQEGTTAQACNVYDAIQNLWTAGQAEAMVQDSTVLTGYPPVGIAKSTGTAWDTSFSTTGSGTVAALQTSPNLLGTPTAPTAPNGTSTSQLATTSFASGTPSLGVNGYQLFPSGLIIQWGVETPSAANTSYTYSFPIPFPNNLFSITTSAPSTTTPTNTALGTVLSTSQFSLTQETGGIPQYWMAIGK
jgi:hypothetical protein